MFRWTLLLLTVINAFGQPIPGRYIIELDTDPLAVSKSERAASSLRSQQEFVKSVLSSRKINVRATTDTVLNAIIVDNATAEQLASLPGVRRIEQAKYMKTNLDHVMPLLKYQDAWSIAGGQSKAGAGIKIGIVDTGIDHNHLGFIDDTLPTPDGFPKFSPDGNSRFVNKKIIVARSYNGTASDLNGHGTGVAMAAAGVFHLGARGNMAGSAPKAWLGNYRVADGSTGNISTDASLQAMDDAVKDGMDVINMSFGGPAISSENDEVLTTAINNAVSSGIVVVTAAGNDGPDGATIADVGSTTLAISVGATENDRIPTSPAVIVSNSTRFFATPASNSEDADFIQAKMVDITKLDPTGFACAPFPDGSLTGSIALIQRGDCTFQDKLANVRVGGAVAAVVFDNTSSTTRVSMAVDNEVLKALFVTRADGNRLKDSVATNPDINYILFFSFSVPENPNQLTDFSAKGPTPDLAIKPDVLATGGNIITATNGTPADSPELSGYVIEDGTSLSSPIVAGVAGVLKQVRPGLKAAQYRSMIVNSAFPFPAGSNAIDVQSTGVGLINFVGTLNAVITSDPVTLSLSEYRGQAEFSRDFQVGNVGQNSDTYSLRIISRDDLQPSLSRTSVTVDAGGSQSITLRWSTTTAGPGAYQGFIEITSANTSTVARVPYWLAVRGKDVKSISLTSATDQAATGSSNDILFRVLDGAGLSLLEPAAEVTIASGGGSIIRAAQLAGQLYPGLYVVRVRLGASAGVNAFKISAGGVDREVRIQGAN